MPVDLSVGLPAGMAALVFRCRVVRGAPAPSAEAAETAWLTVEQLTSRMDEAYAIRLPDALAAGPVPIRAHNGRDS